ncbi:copper resistance protein B [Reyranella sp.]|uniref:copper resistance protein B n=1 Tax=Reyranella sp. TaxID=1929291 RepID=UPI003D1349F3
MRIISSALLLLLFAGPAMAMDDQTTFWRVDGLFTRRISSAPDTQWKASAWVGGDRDKLRLQSSGILTDTGHIEGEGGTQGIDNRLFYSRLIAPFWDAKAGVQLSLFDRGQTRAAFLAGVEGLAPYGIHLDVVAGISETGIASLRLDAEYDILLSQKLVAQPFAEAMLASGNDPAIGLGAGLPRFEVGLRLRYEIEKEFAPFVGVSFEQFTGNTANYAAADGEATSRWRALVGLKVWF